ncbi:MAG TPA: hypothetical protein VJT67_16465, partial [Longimicrobiaceae bacterium]|nr:hypothetical protein [Longimicrobiaceae bacterium]
MSVRPARKRRGRSFERQVLRLSFITGALGTGTAILLLWTGDYTGKVRWTLTLFLLAGWVISAVALREQVVRPVQVLSNLLSA